MPPANRGAFLNFLSEVPYKLFVGSQAAWTSVVTYPSGKAQVVFVTHWGLDHQVMIHPANFTLG